MKTTSLPAGSAGVSYSAHLAASGGIAPYTWSITSGSLPAGLSVNTATGGISGKPTAGGPASFTVQVSDSENPSASASADLSISVTVAPLTLVTASLPAATADVSYSVKLDATGGIPPLTWSITSGSLPAGLSLDPATGKISGKPTAVGTASFTVSVSDAENPAASASADLSITVSAAPLVITTASVLPTATVGAPYSMRLAASGGLTPYTWSITPGSLPTGLKFHANTGVISGTPTGTAASTFTAEVSDSQNPAASASATFSLDVEVTPQVTTTSLSAATEGQQYSASLAVSGGLTPFTWSITAGSLPDGLSLDPATGNISGTPTSPGTSTFTAAVTDSANPAETATASVSIAVLGPVMTTTSLPAATSGQPYSASLSASGGTAPYTWSITAGSLPDGLSLDPATGGISGTPTSPGFEFAVTVTDSANPAGTATAYFVIDVLGLVIDDTSVPGASCGSLYIYQLSASGGTAPYTWSITSGSLPSGFTLNSKTGTISGADGACDGGQSSFTVTVTDSENPAATASASFVLHTQ